MTDDPSPYAVAVVESLNQRRATTSDLRTAADGTCCMILGSCHNVQFDMVAMDKAG